VYKHTQHNMKLSFPSAFAFTGAVFLRSGISSYPFVSAEKAEFGEVPPKLKENGAKEAWKEFVADVFPTWCIDKDEKRIFDTPKCNDGTINGRWDPLYLTKWYGGADPALGGYPTDIDTRYPFYYGSPFFGQACAGGNSHCSFDFDGGKYNCARCGKIVTNDDNGPNGPGHVPPHIGLAALTRAYYDGGFGKVETWFDFDQNGCRVLPDVLLTMIRSYFKRDKKTGEVKYPPPFTDEGGCGSSDGTYPYPLEFVNLAGESCVNEKKAFPSAQCYEDHSGSVKEYPPYLKAGHGSPHYCSKVAKKADVYNDWYKNNKQTQTHLLPYIPHYTTIMIISTCMR